MRKADDTSFWVFLEPWFRKRRWYLILQQRSVCAHYQSSCPVLSQTITVLWHTTRLCKNKYSVG